MEGTKLASSIKYYTDYASFDEETGQVENWEDSVSRIMNMHRTKYARQIAKSEDLAAAINFAEEAYLNKDILGSQRALQWGGPPMLKHEAKMYNCVSSHVNRLEFFQEAMYFLLCGCGAGFSVQEHHIRQMPLLARRDKHAKTFVIEDSIEGWSDAIGVLASSYTHVDFACPFPEYQGHHVAFDYSNIRPKDAKITGGFKAPGPEGLRNAAGKIEGLMDNFIQSREAVTWTDILAYDFIMHMTQAVLSGGVRRSATICLFSPWSTAMLKAKTGNWMVDNPQRARSNNSAVLLRGGTSFKDFSELFENIKQYGEPGFVFVEDRDITVNPCVTEDTTVLTSEGVQTVANLIDKPFKAVIDGQEYEASGFWKTGNKETFKLQTKEGHSLTLTENHKVLTTKGWREAGSLVQGDKIKLQNHGDYFFGGATKDLEIGWLLGSLVGDGTFREDKTAVLRYWGEETYLGEIAREFLNAHCKVHRVFKAQESSLGILSFESVKLAEIAKYFGVFKNSKTPNSRLEKTTSEFYKGYLKGLFDADGSVQGTQSNGVSIRLSQSNLPLLEQVQRMLLRLGINSTIYSRRKAGYRKLPDGRGGLKDYFCKENYELIISKVNLVNFSNKIGFYCFEKQDKLDKAISRYKRKPNKEKFEATFTSLTPMGQKDVYDVTVEEVHCFDANGLTAHNCVEIGMWPIMEETGIPGWQGCNLVEINGGKCYTQEQFYRACRAGSIMATLQAGYTNFRYLPETTRQIFEREALLGVSVTGWTNNPEVLFNTDTQREGAEIVKAVNKRIAKLIGINQAARTTCVKPSGNASVVLGTASGIHGEHAPRYFRNMQMNKSNDIAKIFARCNPDAVEDSVWNPEDTDWVFSIPTIAPKDSLFKRHLVGINQLELVRLTQNNWVEYGTNEHLCVNPIVRHNVSNTIQVDNWDAVRDYLYKHRDDFAGVSLLGITGDKDYPQAPFTEVFTRSQLLEFYGDAALFASGLIVDGMHAFNDDLWLACSVAMGLSTLKSKGTSLVLQRDWVRRAHKFANNYFDGDMGTCTYCLKDLYNYHKWCKISNNLIDIDWSDEDIQPRYIEVDTLASAACVGGVCETGLGA